MAAYPVVVVDDELIEKLPERFKSDARYQKGASLELVPVARPVVAESESAWDKWLSLQGLWANSDFDPNAELEAEKQRELAQEARWRD